MKAENKDRYICPFPGCGKTFWKDKDQPDMCPYHRQLCSDMFFINKHVKFGPKPTKSGLIIAKPGDHLPSVDEAVQAEMAKKGIPK